MTTGFFALLVKPEERSNKDIIDAIRTILEISVLYPTRLHIAAHYSMSDEDKETLYYLITQLVPTEDSYIYKGERVMSVEIKGSDDNRRYAGVTTKGTEFKDQPYSTIMTAYTLGHLVKNLYGEELIKKAPLIEGLTEKFLQHCNFTSDEAMAIASASENPTVWKKVFEFYNKK